MPRGTSPKSERTKAAIERAAARQFRERGFDATTIRDIAAEAGTDPSLVIRYFKNKDSLFARVAEPRLELPELVEVARQRLIEGVGRAVDRVAGRVGPLVVGLGVTCAVALVRVLRLAVVALVTPLRQVKFTGSMFSKA